MKILAMKNDELVIGHKVTVMVTIQKLERERVWFNVEPSYYSNFRAGGYRSGQKLTLKQIGKITIQEFVADKAVCLIIPDKWRFKHNRASKPNAA